MRTSEQINELAAALSKAQGEIVGALKDSSNPFFKSKYADLASCWDACRKQLSSNGLAVIQGAETRYSDAAIPAQIVTTLLTHSSGQWIESILQVHPKDDSPQAAGSAITYARRYALAAIVGVAQVDDDGEAAQGRTTNGVVQGHAIQEERPDTQRVNLYLERIYEANRGDNEPLMKQLWAECNENKAFASSVWTLLSRPLKEKLEPGHFMATGARKHG